MKYKIINLKMGQLFLLKVEGAKLPQTLKIKLKIKLKKYEKNIYAPRYHAVCWFG